MGLRSKKHIFSLGEEVNGLTLYGMGRSCFEWCEWLRRVQESKESPRVGIPAVRSLGFETKRGDNRPYLKIQIFDAEIIELVDSGSTLTVLS